MSIDELQDSTGQQDPRRPRRTRALAVAAAIAAAALAAGITVALWPAPAAPPPLVAVTSALARTSEQSYTFSLSTTVRIPKRQLGSDLVSGAYDPVQRRGTELLTAHSTSGQASRAQIRFIGPYLYTSVSPLAGFSKPWDKTARAAAAPPGDLYGFVSDQPVSPAELTALLRARSTAVHASGPASGPGWTGTKYTFTARLYGGGESVSGTVYVDDQGRVRRLVTTTEQGRPVAGRPRVTTVRDLTFAGFGAPVQVTSPPASQVEYTSAKPYWGFFF